MKTTITPALARAAAHDAATKRMRSQGRRKWNAGDYRTACIVLARLTRLAKNK